MKETGKVFGVLQRVGRAFMLPIAVLPVAGLLLGIGRSLTNETMLRAYHPVSYTHLIDIYVVVSFPFKDRMIGTTIPLYFGGR